MRDPVLWIWLRPCEWHIYARPPPDHPRVAATIERIERDLAIDGFVYRFDPKTTLESPVSPLGDYEAAFLPCTFWLATAYAKAGRPERAERILQRAEAVAGEGWFGEAIDPRDMTFRGNFPLMFSQIEYVRAVLETAKAKPLQAAAMMVGKAVQKAEQLLASSR